MTIELSRDTRDEAIASIEQYFRENMDEPISRLAAGELLNFFLQEIAPCVYNRAVADVQDRMQARVMELDIDIHHDEFQYWRQRSGSRKGPG